MKRLALGAAAFSFLLSLTAAPAFAAQDQKMAAQDQMATPQQK